jgi:N-methylhydantoinase A
MLKKLFLGIDTGGTFTDFVLFSNEEVKIHKVLSTPNDPARSILQGIADLELVQEMKNGDLAVIHGSTVATNAALEGKGVSTAYITNRGMGDILTIARQTRAEIYALTPEPGSPPVPDSHVIETGGRLDSSGNVIEPLTEQDLYEIGQSLNRIRPEAVAINLLFSFLDDRFEKQVEQSLEGRYFVSRSSQILPEYKEYERGIATWLNAWLGPIINDYLSSLMDAMAPCSLAIMQSSGRTMAANQAAGKAVNLLLSGPAAGLAGARHMGSINHQHRLMSFDMGGTSTDVALIDHQIKLTSEGFIGPYPVAIPMADMHTIGSGGGSIAYLDAGNLLQVGPQSAGADPGPACYGLGGTLPTVTDANVVLGRLLPEAFLGGRMPLHLPAARAAIAALSKQMKLSIEETAAGIVQLANEKMTQALRVISIQRGFDPKQFQLVCFGGAGGLHFCALAEALEIRRALVPLFGGVLSAFGMLVAPPGRQLSRTHNCLLESAVPAQLDNLYGEMLAQGREELEYEGIAASNILEERSVDLRYAGQSYTLNLPWKDPETTVAEFHKTHDTRYGHRLERHVELVNLRISLSAPGQDIELPSIDSLGEAVPKSRQTLYGFDEQVNIYAREDLGRDAVIKGPALITETVATTLIHPAWTATVDRVGNLLLEREY